MEKRIPNSSAVINKVKRIPIVVFFKRIVPILIFFLLFYLSIVFGLWNVKDIIYNSNELKNVKETELDSYVSEFIGKNIFSLKPSLVEKRVLESNGYIKEVYIKKILPNKLNISIKEYTPLYLGYSSDVCLLFADTGEKLLEVCKECKEECSNALEDTSLVNITSDSLLENAGGLIYFEEIYKIQRVLSTFKYELESIVINDGIAKVYDLDSHEFIFDLSYELDIQLARMYLVGQKIDKDLIKFRSLDLRFERPVMKLK